MVINSRPEDGSRILEITTKTEMFNSEEVQCVADIWQQQLEFGIEASGYTFFVDIEGGQVLGFVCVGLRGLADRVFDLYWIAVDPAVQRMGVGRRLLGSAEKMVREKNGRIMVIETSGAKKYTGTRDFYCANGYIHEATLRDLYSDGDDLCIYTKRINY